MDLSSKTTGSSLAKVVVFFYLAIPALLLRSICFPLGGSFLFATSLLAATVNGGGATLLS